MQRCVQSSQGALPFQDVNILLWTDSHATRAYIMKGAGRSEVMFAMMKRIFGYCVVLKCSIWAEWKPGVLLVEAGVDACSRAGEVCLSRAVFEALQRDVLFGRREGFTGFTVDAFASAKTKCAFLQSHRGWHGVIGGLQRDGFDSFRMLLHVPTSGAH